MVLWASPPINMINFENGNNYESHFCRLSIRELQGFGGCWSVVIFKLYNGMIRPDIASGACIHSQFHSFQFRDSLRFIIFSF